MSNTIFKTIEPNSLSGFQMWQVNTYGYYLGKGDTKIFPKDPNQDPLNEDDTDEAKELQLETEENKINNFYEQQNDNYYE